MVKKAVAPAKKVAVAASKPSPAVKAAPRPAAKTAVAPATKPVPMAPVTGAAAPKASPAKAPPARATPQKLKESVKESVKAVAPAKPRTKVPAKPTATASAAAAVPVAHATPAVAAEPRRVPVAAKKAPAPVAPTLPPVKGETKEGLKYTKDFDAKFLTAQHKLLVEARISLTGQAVRLEDEANSLIDEEMGDVQFDDESGEGDTMVVERERDLFLSARARQDIEEIDGALRRLEIGSYGYSVVSMKPIPRERLEAIPWATELTEEKVGGIGRR